MGIIALGTICILNARVSWRQAAFSPAALCLRGDLLGCSP